MEKDKVNPKGRKWEFDEQVTKVFGDMLSRSIPNYETMRELCFMVGRNFVKPNGMVSDIGCSNGLASENLLGNFLTPHLYLAMLANRCLTLVKQGIRTI